MKGLAFEVVDHFAGVLAGIGEENAEFEIGDAGRHLGEVDAEGGTLAVELGQHPLAVDETAVLDHAGEVVAHFHVQHTFHFLAFLEVERLDVGGCGVAHDHEIAKGAHVGFEPAAGFALDAALDQAGGEGRRFVALELAENELLGLEADDDRDAEGPGAVRGIGAAEGLDGVDGRDVAAVVLKAVGEDVVVVNHAGGHFNLIVATVDLEGPADGEAVGAEVVGWVFRHLVHGDEGFEMVSYIETADGLVAVVVGDGDGDAVEGGVAVDEADAAVAKGAGILGRVTHKAAGENVGLTGGGEVVPVELGIDGAGVAVGNLVDPILKEGRAVDPNVDAVVAVVHGGAFGAVGGVDAHIETPKDGQRIVGRAESAALAAEVDLVGGLGSVETGVFVDRQESDALNGGRDGVVEGDAVGQGVERLLGAGVAHFVVEVGAAAHAAVAGVGDELSALDGQSPFGDDGVEGIALVGALKGKDVVGNGAMVAVEM